MSGPSRVRIDPTTGAFEAEGDEQFVREMLNLYWVKPQAEPSLGAEVIQSAVKHSPAKTRKKAAIKAKTEQATKKPKSAGPTEDAAFKVDLQPRMKDLDKYIKERAVKSHSDAAVTIASFVQNEMNRDALTASQYFTALRLLGRKLPKNVAQVLIDAKNKGGFFYANGEGFSLTPTGINHAEHELTVVPGKK